MDATRAMVRALLVPADEHRHCTVVVVPETAAALSDAIGGGLLDEVYQGRTLDHWCCVYGDEERAAKRLPANDRARSLLAQLGWGGRIDARGLRGDLLFVGADSPSADTDVPEEVLRTAARAGLLAESVAAHAG